MNLKTVVVDGLELTEEQFKELYQKVNTFHFVQSREELQEFMKGYIYKVNEHNNELCFYDRKEERMGYCVKLNQ